MPLTTMEREMLELERVSMRPNVKANVIRGRFGMSPTQYYQRLNRLIEGEDALATDPLTVRRLLRLRDDRRARLPFRLQR